MFLGEVPRCILPALYRHATAFVLPSMMESFGNPFVEAMCSGAPVIAADTEFARELCGDAATYFPVGDAAALAARLEEVAEQPVLRARMISEGYRRGSTFSWEREAQETLALLDAAVSRS